MALGGTMTGGSECGSATLTVETAETGGPCIRTITRTYHITRGILATPCFETAQCTQTITVQDTVPPVATTSAFILDRVLECGDAFGLTLALGLAPSFTDNCGAVAVTLTGTDILPDLTCPNAQVIVRRWRAVDACENPSSEFVQTITILDRTAPVATTAPGSLDRTVECGEAAALARALALTPTFVDNCTTVVSPILASTDTVPDPLRPGVYQLVRHWVAADGCGNSSLEFIQSVTVYDNCPRIFGGVRNTLLGSAIAEVISGQFVIRNFSNLGLDGISIDLGAAQFGSVLFECADPGSLPTGANLTLRAFGEVNGIRDQLVAEFQATDVGSEIEYSARFPALGDVPLLAVLYNGDNVVATVRLPSAPWAFARVSGPAGDARSTPYTPMHGRPGMLLEFEDPTFVTLTGGQPTRGTRLVVTADVTKRSFPDNGMDVSQVVTHDGQDFWWQQPGDPLLKHAFIGALSRIDVLARDVPEVRILSEQLGMFGFAHQSIGGTLLQGLGDSFKITPATNQLDGDQGFDIFGSTSQEWGSGTGNDVFEAQWLNLESVPPAPPLPIGASLQAALHGSLDGGTIQLLAGIEAVKTSPNLITIRGSAAPEFPYYMFEVWRDSTLVFIASTNDLTVGSWPVTLDGFIPPPCSAPGCQGGARPDHQFRLGCCRADYSRWHQHPRRPDSVCCLGLQWTFPQAGPHQPVDGRRYAGPASHQRTSPPAGFAFRRTGPPIDQQRHAASHRQ